MIIGVAATGAGKFSWHFRLNSRFKWEITKALYELTDILAVIWERVFEM